MSMSLLKKSMAIVEADLDVSKKQKEKDGLKKKKGFNKKDRYEVVVKKPAHKKTIDDIRKEIQANSTKAEENVKKLLKISKQQVKIKNADKIIRRAHSGRYILDEKQPVVEQESIFTEEDFAAFEKELANTIL